MKKQDQKDSNINRQIFQKDRRGSLLFDDQAINIYSRRRGSKMSDISKPSRRKSETDLQVPNSTTPIARDNLEADDVVSF